MYTKTEGHHCWWLNKDGKALANFDNEKDVDDIIKMQTTIVEQLSEIEDLGYEMMERAERSDG